MLTGLHLAHCHLWGWADLPFSSSLLSQSCFWSEAKAKAAAAQPKARMGLRGAKSLEKLPMWEGSCLSEKQVSNGSK